MKCGKCGGHVRIVTFYDEELKKTMVSHGECQDCWRNIVLEYMPYSEFLRIIGRD